MPVNVSADGLRRGPRVRRIEQQAAFTPGQKFLLLCLNAVPFGHLALSAAIFWLSPLSTAGRLGASLAVFFLAPPLLARLVLWRKLPVGTVAVPSPAFFRWWTTWQLQGVFNRLPWVEELLRLVPGCYSFWLRLWGAKIGRLTLWSPGVRIYDRPLLAVGDDVILGINTRMSGHFGSVDEHGVSCLTLGTVRIADRCTIGAEAFLGPGVQLGSDQFTEVLFLGTPFAHWRNGKRVDAPPTAFP